ncbi:MAG: hypothetical protein M3443_20600 [Actinomycetota bacterium]|nr:hypothetical protein [Actinomycetota bacterium]
MTAWPPVTWISSSIDGREHAIGEEEIAGGRWQRSGVYRAMCGSVVVPTALTAPPGRRCQRCSADGSPPG